MLSSWYIGIFFRHFSFIYEHFVKSFPDIKYYLLFISLLWITDTFELMYVLVVCISKFYDIVLSKYNINTYFSHKMGKNH